MLLKWGRRIWQRTGDERGFTLVELLVVMVIIAVLVGIAYTGYNALQRRAKQAQADSLWRDLNTAVQMAKIEKPSESVTELDDLGDYLDVTEPPWTTATAFGAADPDIIWYKLDPVCVWYEGHLSTKNDKAVCDP